MIASATHIEAIGSALVEIVIGDAVVRAGTGAAACMLLDGDPLPPADNPCQREVQY